jgi:hypothetical protein
MTRHANERVKRFVKKDKSVFKELDGEIIIIGKEK